MGNCCELSVEEKHEQYLREEADRKWKNDRWEDHYWSCQSRSNREEHAKWVERANAESRAYQEQVARNYIY